MTIHISTTVRAPLSKVWQYWTEPEHIVHWNFASEEWCCPSASNDLRPNGSLNWRMEAKDGSMGFDFIGTYEQIIENKFISYKIADGRHVEITFSEEDDIVKISESFEAETIHSEELQRAGWQAILNNFKLYVESN